MNQSERNSLFNQFHRDNACRLLRSFIIGRTRVSYLLVVLPLTLTSAADLSFLKKKIHWTNRVMCEAVGTSQPLRPKQGSLRRTRKMSDSLSGQIYAAILGGKESDALLHRVTEDTVRPFIPGADVVDTGVGRGGLTKRLAQLGPKNLWVTDYQQPSIDRAMRQIASMNGTRPPGLNVHSCLLDLTGDLTALGDTRADVIVCVSVLMHLPPAEAKKAVMKLSRRLKPGGRAVIGVLSASVARALYIPAPSKGECCFYPALKGLPARATEADVPERASSLLEYYPPDQFYRAVCEETGLRVSVVDALPGDECKGSIYESVSGPLWKLFVLES